MYRHRSSADLILPDDQANLPYYGGLKGQFLQLKNGKLQKFSLRELQTNAGQRQPIATANAYNPFESKAMDSTTFEEDFNKIQAAAARLVTIQELAKQKGTFSDDDNRVYAASLLELGQAAQNLAKLQQTGQIKDFSVLLQPYQAVPHKTPQHSSSDDSISVIAAATKEDESKVEPATEAQITESELLPGIPLDPYEDNNDSVAIIPPKKDASVAEAKPVGISIAGEGGVASSKPNAVALSGRNGLAVSAPKATALAGVTPEEAAAFSITLPSRNQLVLKSASSRLALDDYDYLDSAPEPTSNNRNLPLLRSASPASSSKRENSQENRIKPIPMMGTISAADAIVKMWRTAIAENYAAINTDEDREPPYDLEELYRASKWIQGRKLNRN